MSISFVTKPSGVLGQVNRSVKNVITPSNCVLTKSTMPVHVPAIPSEAQVHKPSNQATTLSHTSFTVSVTEVHIPAMPAGINANFSPIHVKNGASNLS